MPVQYPYHIKWLGLLSNMAAGMEKMYIFLCSDECLQSCWSGRYIGIKNGRCELISQNFQAYEKSPGNQYYKCYKLQ